MKLLQDSVYKKRITKMICLIPDKLNRRFVEQAPASPGFYSLDYVVEVLNNGSVNFPPPTKSLVLLLERSVAHYSGGTDETF